MLGKGFSSALRAFNSGVRGWHQPAVRTAKRTCSAAAAGSALGPVFGEGGRAALRLGSAMLGGGAIGVAFGKAQQDEPRGSQDLPLSSTASMPWVQELEARESVQEVLAPSDMLRKHPVGKVLLDKDHLFEGMQTSGQINEFRCFYDSSAKEFHSVVHLGKDVCGFPQTVHGGLTAAIMDETLGGLGVCMWRSGALGFRPPAYTARLEVDYKRKIPAGSVIHCKTHVEKVDDRKIWMRGQVTDGSGVVYASARALFVAPRMRNVLLGWIPGMQKKQ